MTDKPRCTWCLKDELYIKYHDEVWGIPEYNSRKLFEFLCLEGAQAGLSWYSILKRIPAYEIAFHHWDANQIVKMDEQEIENLMHQSSIIRNRSKIESVINNARLFLEIEEKSGGFSEFIWEFVGGNPRINNFKSLSEIPASTAESTAMSKSLKSIGFKFVGPTICYAFMQATGMVNDHVLSCYTRR